MNKINAVLLSIALFLPIVIGCRPEEVAATEGIEVVSVKLEDWTNPKDGKQYVVALPTWKNNGKEPVRQVSFWPELKGMEWKEPEGFNEGPTYYGDAVEPGTTVEPVKTPQDGVVLGSKDEFKELKAEDVTMTAVASPEKYEPPTKSDT